MTHPSPQPRRYRLRIYDGEYEVLHHRTHIVTLDLGNPGYDGALDRHIQALTRQAIAAGESMDCPRLEVWDVETGARVLDWAGA